MKVDHSKPLAEILLLPHILAVKLGEPPILELIARCTEERS